MIESGALIDREGNVSYWHLPEGRTGGSLPDSRDLWAVIWEHHQADNLLGFAHSHPGSGMPGPSPTDITTFSAIELALGRRLTWWITSANACAVIKWLGPEKYKYGISVLPVEPGWTNELRALGNPPEIEKEGT